MAATIGEMFGSGGREAPRTAFERTLLPGFAAWVIEQLDRLEPDYIIPVETKGARLLDAVLVYAREELGIKVQAPVIYASGLDYLCEEQLRGSRVVIIDDVVRTGANLDRHRRDIEGRGIGEIEALACIGCSERGSPLGGDVDCYLRVEAERFTQYLWQLSELVVSPGLPPEVDHFMFELRPSERFAVAWQRLQTLLADWGQLTVDGPVGRREQILPITLHFPLLPGMAELDEQSIGSGPQKLRLFPDPEGERVLIVPMSLSAVQVESQSELGTVSRTAAERAVGEAVGASEIGETLIAEARTIDARTVFRAISAARETDMILALAALLGGELAPCALHLHQKVLARLYGPEVAKRISALIEEKVQSALGNGSQAGNTPLAGPRVGEHRAAGSQLYLDGKVAASTREMGELLKRRYEEASADGGEPEGRIGLSMPQLAVEVGGQDFLLASRCVDFGCALTALVPYVEVLDIGGSRVEVQRRYRVSEPNRRDGAYRDVEIVRCEKSEQAVAVICKRLRERCDRYRDCAVPLELLAQVIAILRPLALEEQSLTLESLAGVARYARC